jgi:hypothetical protein
MNVHSSHEDGKLNETAVLAPRLQDEEGVFRWDAKLVQALTC